MPRADLYASGLCAEGIRMALRCASLQPEWCAAAVGVETAFLQAPRCWKESGGKKKLTLVKVPQLLRRTGITSSRF